MEIVSNAKMDYMDYIVNILAQLIVMEIVKLQQVIVINAKKDSGDMNAEKIAMITVSVNAHFRMEFVSIVERDFGEMTALNLVLKIVMVVVILMANVLNATKDFGEKNVRIFVSKNV
jgi:hypothetical protein